MQSKRQVKADHKDTPQETIDKDLKYKNKVNFTMLVGDDTGLLKKVHMVYNYQTEVVGDDQPAKRRKTDSDGQEESSVKAKDEEFDEDGQPVLRMLRNEVRGKQTDKYGE
jgi:hypothetical protein